MEKELTPAALRRAALTRGPAASASPSAPPEPKPSASKAAAAKVAALKSAPKKAGATKKNAGAKTVVTRQRTIPETRAQMLERLTNPMISLHEASVILRVCSATVRRMANDGELPHLRTPGGQRRFFLRDVQQVLERREKEKNGGFVTRPKKRAAPPLDAKAERSLEARALLDATRARLRGTAPASSAAPRRAPVGGSTPGPRSVAALLRGEPRAARRSPAEDDEAAGGRGR